MAMTYNQLRALPTAGGYGTQNYGMGQTAWNPPAMTPPIPAGGVPSRSVNTQLIGGHPGFNPLPYGTGTGMEAANSSALNAIAAAAPGPYYQGTPHMALTRAPSGGAADPWGPNWGSFQSEPRVADSGGILAPGAGDPWSRLRMPGQGGALPAEQRTMGGLLGALMGGGGMIGAHLAKNKRTTPMNEAQKRALDNPAAAKAKSQGKSSYTINGTMMPTKTIGGKPRNTYADRGGSLTG